jgi:hypothetical protein
MIGNVAVETNPISESDSCSINGVTVRSISNKKISIPITLESDNPTIKNQINALVDCGAEGMFIDESIANKWRRENLKKPIKVRNDDGTANINGEITEKCLVSYDINGRKFAEWFYVTSIGDQDLILGLPWLERHNPIIDWRQKTLELRTSVKDSLRVAIRNLTLKWDESDAPEDTDLVIRYIKSQMGPQCTMDTENSWKNDSHQDLEIDDVRRWAGDETLDIFRFSPSQKIAHEYQEEKGVELPLEYKPWASVFEKKASERIPD